MKTLLLLICLPVCLVFASCDQQVFFSAPQPAQTQALPIFPPQLHGNYYTLQKEAVLNITATHIILRYQHTNVNSQAINTKDSVPVIVRDSALDNKTNNTESEDETLFDLQGNTVLKAFKNIYFLNKSNPNGQWQLTALMPKPGYILLGSLSGEAAIKTLNNLTSASCDTCAGVYNLNPAQLELLVAQNTFVCDTFYTMTFAKQ